MKLTSIFAVLFAAMMLPTDINAAITIDTYTAGTTLTQFGAGTASQTTTSATILGGQRQETLVVTSQGGNEFFGTIGFSGEMDVAQGSLDQINGSVVYDNFGSIDITEGGTNDAFELGFLSSDINAPLQGVVSVTVGSGANSSSQFVTVPPNSTLPQNVLVDFASFASNGVNMSAIDSISLSFNFSNNPGRDFELGLFSATSAIPEPASGLLAVVGMLALTRRRKKA